MLNELRRNLQRSDSKMQIFELEGKHLEHSRLVTDRNMLLFLLPKNGIVAEVGVDEGDYSQRIIDTCAPKKLHLIDSWGSERYNGKKKKLVESRFNSQIKNGIIEINTGLSIDMAKRFPDEYFDWIYLDTDHSYETTIEELIVFSTKIKRDGLILGHDYITGNLYGFVKYGVIEAVHEFCVRFNWEIVYLTAETQFPPSFAIKRRHED